MVKLLVLLACVLGTACAATVPLARDDGMYWRLWRYQNIRPTVMDVIRQRLFPENVANPMQMEDNVEEDRYQRIPVQRQRFEDVDRQVNRNVERYAYRDVDRDVDRYVDRNVDRNVDRDVDRELPTTDVDSNRLLVVGRRRQQQLDEPQPQESRRPVFWANVGRRVDQTVKSPRRVERIGEGRRVGVQQEPISEEDIVQFIRRDDRLADLSDEEIIEMLRRNRQNRRDEDDDDMPRRVGRIGEGRRVVERRGDEYSVRDRFVGRQEEQEEVDSLPTVRRDDKRLVYINRRRQEQVEDVKSPLRIAEGRRVVERQEQTVKDRVTGLREEDRLVGRRVGQEGVENLPTVRRDDERLVHINRRRVEQTEEEISPRRIEHIGEGRRVGNPISDQDILRFIRRDNRLMNYSDEEVIAMIQRNRQRKEQARQEQEEEQQRRRQQEVERNQIEDNEEDSDEDVISELPTVSRDDSRLVYVNRRRINQNEEQQVTPRGEEPTEETYTPMTEQDILKLIRRDNRLPELSDEEIIELLRRNRQLQEQVEQQQMERRRRVSHML